LLGLLEAAPALAPPGGVLYARSQEARPGIAPGEACRNKGIGRFLMTRSLAPSLAFAAALALAADALPASAQTLEKLSMSIASTSMNYAPYFIPIEKGYFKEEGFEIEIVKAAGGAATPALLSGQTDISTSGSAALSAILKGGQMKIIFYPWDQLTYQVWSTKPEIKTIQDVKGKAVGIQSRGDTFETSMRLVLLKHGMDPNSVSYTPLGFGDARRAAIASGSLPVAIISPQDVDELKKVGLLKNATLIYDMYKKIELPLTGHCRPLGRSGAEA
jgi:ABC-type nitrate/sulfonate/bicarbonate transport system substrate-binding protein